MTPIAVLADLAAVPERAVIINCGTKWVSSLALLSTLRHAACPTLVIDCDSRDGSRAHFERIARDLALRFHWLEWPLRPHPEALDVLFREAGDNRLLLVDSDLEIRTAVVIAEMRQALDDDPKAYGAGFAHGPSRMGADHGLAPDSGYYAERMWIPCVLLRVSHIRAALARGVSFANRRVFPSVRGRGVEARLRSIAHQIVRQQRATPMRTTWPLPRRSSWVENRHCSSNTIPAPICTSHCGKAAIGSLRFRSADGAKCITFTA